MDKGKAVMGSGRRWAVEFTDNSVAPSSRDIPDPPGFTRSSHDQVQFYSIFCFYGMVFVFFVCLLMDLYFF